MELSGTKELAEAESPDKQEHAALLVYMPTSSLLAVLQ